MTSEVNTPPDMDALIVKIQRLLDTKGRTEEEAAAYVAKAYDLLQKYDLDMETVKGDLRSDARSSVGDKTGIGVARHGKPEGWKVDLFRAVARSADCRVAMNTYDTVTRTRGTFARLIGRHSDIEVAGYTFEYLVAELVRLSDEFGRERWQEIWDYANETGISKHEAERNWVRIHGSHPLRAKLSWLKGATESVIQTLTADKAARTATTDATRALVVNKSAEIDDYLKRERAKMYGMTVEAYDEYVAAARARYAAEAKPVKPETDAQRRKREEREARQNARYNQRYWNEQDRIGRTTDWSAYERGQSDGQSISIRRGVRSGDKARAGLEG